RRWDGWARPLRTRSLYKRYHLAMETAEKVLTGSDQEDWVLDKARYLRVESELRATRCRCASASLALLALRRTQTRQRARWGQQGGGLWRAFCSTLSTAQHTMEPPFVKPPPPAVLLYAAELLHLLLHLPEEPSRARPSGFWTTQPSTSTASRRHPRARA
ncbi:unnamed protein product, partial [Effrenium voratum]